MRIRAVNRRNFLAAVGIAGLAVACDATDAGGGERSSNRLRIPPVLAPDADPSGVRRFALTLRTGRTEFVRGRPTETWGVNGPYLGPTVRVTRGDRVGFRVTNRLPEESTLHWHGMRLPAVMDGTPHQTIAPGETWSPQWTVEQPAGTLWYHPHPHGTSAHQAYRGVAGLLLVDDEPSGLPSTYGTDDIPLIIQDRTFDENGALVEAPREDFGILGKEVLLNGTRKPVLTVGTTLVRFRLLNASNARRYHIGFTDDRQFAVVAGDVGLLPTPVTVDRMPLSAGERVEIVVPFTPGETAVLHAFGGKSIIEAGEFDLLRIVATHNLTHSPPLPNHLPAPPPVTPPANARVRRLDFGDTTAFNGRQMDMNRIDDIVPAGATEIWELTNHNYPHNFHMHEVAFTVLDITGTPPPKPQQGRKDTVHVPQHSVVRLAVEFGQHTNPNVPYMYHCHILQHQDRGMMGQFTIVPPGTESNAPRQLAH
jgi:suppressor of ftsI